MFQVRWSQESLDELADSWLHAASSTRQAITTASHAIEQRLVRDPHNEGESREPGKKITFEPPLAVTFQIEDDGRTVSVLQVRVFRPHH